jgi:hypothetical protein
MTDINNGRVPSKSPAPTADAAMMEHKNTHPIQMYLFIVTSDHKTHSYSNIENLILPLSEL